MSNRDNSRLLHIQLTANSISSQNTEFNVNLHGGNELITSFDKSNDNSPVKFQYRPVYNNIAEYECVTVIDVTGNTTWSYADRNMFYKNLYTQTYTEGSQIIMVANGVITLNLSQATTFLVLTGDYFPSLNNHTVTTINIIKPNVPETVTYGTNIIMMNVQPISAATWRSANVRWPDANVPGSTHNANSYVNCGPVDVYTLMNFHNVPDYPRTNTYTISLINPNAEYGNTYGWTGNRSFSVANTTVVANANGSFSFHWPDSNPGLPGGGLGAKYTGVATQKISIDTNDTILLSDIDSGKANINIGWYQKGFCFIFCDGWTGGMSFIYYDQSNTMIGAAASTPTNPPTDKFYYQSFANTMPSNTRYIDVQMIANKTGFGGFTSLSLKTYIDNIQPIKIERFWNEPGAIKDVANTQQNKIWYGFAPYIRKRFVWPKCHDVTIIMRNQPSPSWIVEAEFARYKNHWPNRVTHFVCIDNDPGNNGTPYFPLPRNAHYYDDVSEPTRVYYIDTENSNPANAVDWFEMLGLQDEICYGGTVRFQGRYVSLRDGWEHPYSPIAPMPYGYELMYSPDCGIGIMNCVRKCKDYGITTIGNIAVGYAFDEIWLTPMDSIGPFTYGTAVSSYMNDHLPPLP